jgi:uncharacterized protein YdbL (DUF1318 family)
MKTFKRLLVIFLAFMFAGCTLAKVKIDVVSERTTLENQVLGTYNALDRDMLLVASVRGVEPDGQLRKPPRQSQERKDAVEAMQTLAFHEDDLAAFKRLAWVGENNEGQLTVFPMDKADAPADLQGFAGRYSQEEFAAVVSQINQAREVVMQRVTQLNENLTEADMPSIKKVFASLNRDNAKPGEKIQREDGTWTTKE